MLERALLALVLVLGISTGLQTLRLANERTAHQTTKTQAAEARAAYANERTRVAVAFGKHVTQTLATQQELMTKAAKAQEVQHAQVSAARAFADDLLRRLRAQSNAPRPAAPELPSTAEAAATAAPAVQAGAVIPLGIGEQLVSLALRADELRADAIACRRQYEDARLALEAMSREAPQ